MPSDYEKAELSRLKAELLQLHKLHDMWRSKAMMRENRINHLLSLLHIIAATVKEEVQ